METYNYDDYCIDFYMRARMGVWACARVCMRACALLVCMRVLVRVRVCRYVCMRACMHECARVYKQTILQYTA